RAFAFAPENRLQHSRSDTLPLKLSSLPCLIYFGVFSPTGSFVLRGTMRKSVFLIFTALFFLSGTLFSQQFDGSLYLGMRWRLVGPFRGGRSVAVAGV